MNETDAVIGGESSGGLTVRGHIKGKDGVYAASLLVEMIAVVGKRLSEIMHDIENEFGRFYTEEKDYRFDLEKKEEVFQKTLIDKLLPNLPFEIDKISYLDGCKIYFQNGGWIIIRFSGTEPLLRICCEMPKPEDAKLVCDIYEEFLDIK
jgi:phosphomannomutase